MVTDRWENVNVADVSHARSKKNRQPYQGQKPSSHSFRTHQQNKVKTRKNRTQRLNIVQNDRKTIIRYYQGASWLERFFVAGLLYPLILFVHFFVALIFLLPWRFLYHFSQYFFEYPDEGGAALLVGCFCLFLTIALVKVGLIPLLKQLKGQSATPEGVPVPVNVIHKDST